MSEEQQATGGEDFRFVIDWQAMQPREADDLVAFWLREGAIPDAERARERLSQVVLHARAPDGDIAAVCTAYLAQAPQLRQPMYHYRSFVGARWRHTLLVRRLFKAAWAVLEDYARAHGFPAIGVAVELENPRFAKFGGANRPVWHSGLIYVGKNQRGLDVRIRYFDGAQLLRE